MVMVVYVSRVGCITLRKFKWLENPTRPTYCAYSTDVALLIVERKNIRYFALNVGSVDTIKGRSGGAWFGTLQYQTATYGYKKLFSFHRGYCVYLKT